MRSDHLVITTIWRSATLQSDLPKNFGVVQLETNFFTALSFWTEAKHHSCHIPKSLAHVTSPQISLPWGRHLF